MKIGKKLIALFLSVVMVMSLLPVAALAEGESEPATAAEDTGATVTVKPEITWFRTKELVYSETGLASLYAGSKTDYESVSNSKGTIKWDFATVSDSLGSADVVTGDDNVWDYGKNTQYASKTDSTKEGLGIIPQEGVSAATWNNRSTKGAFDSGSAKSYTVRKISGTFTWPEGYDLTSNIELVSKNDANYSAIYNCLEQEGNEDLKAAFGGKKVIAVNDDMYVFIYKDGATLTGDNYTDYLAFWTGTAGKGVWSWKESTSNWGTTWNQTEPATFNTDYALRAFHGIYPNMETAQPTTDRATLPTDTKLNQSDNWYAFADGNAISTVLNSQYNAADFKGGEKYHIDIYCFDTDKVGGMDELELKLTKAAPTEANVTVRYWLNSVGASTEADNFLGSSIMTGQKIGDTITLADGTSVNQLNYKKAEAITKNGNKDVADGEQMNELVVTADSDKNIINVLYVPAGNKVVHLYAGKMSVPYNGNEYTVKDVTIKENGYTDIVVLDSISTTSHELNDGSWRDKNTVVNITAQRTETLPGIYAVNFDAESFVKSSSGQALGNYTVIQHPGELKITYDPNHAVRTYDFGVTNSYSDVLKDVETKAQSVTVDDAHQGYVTVDKDTNTITYIPQSVNTGETVTLTLTYAGGYICEKKITFLPASNVLYEESFITNDGTNKNWSVADTAAPTVVSDNENSVYGYTESYEYFNEFSNGAALKATLNLNGGRVAYTKDKATFTFTGTGFDLISECGTDTGMLIVSVRNKTDNTAVKAYIVDTYFCGDEGLDEGLDGLITGSGILDYQVPVVRCMDLPYGDYTVSVMGYLSDGSGASVATKSKSLFSTQAASLRSTGVDTDAILRTVGLDEFIGCDVSVSFMDENSVLNGGTGPVVETTKTASSKLSGIFNWFKSLFSGRVSTQAADESTGSSDISVYLDAFRVYQPLDNEAKYSENEKALKYGSFYDYIVGSAPDFAEGYIDNSMVYMEYDGEQDIAVIKEYKAQGPQNEVYLSEGNYVGFYLDDYEAGDTVMVSAKAVSGAAALGYYDSDYSPTPIDYVSLSATEMYYDVTSCVQTDDDGNYYLILGNIGEGVLSISGIKLPETVTPGASEALVDYTKPTESTTFDPEQFDVKCAASARKGKNVVITAKTSLDVGCVAVFYDANLADPVKEAVPPNNQKAVKNGKATVYSFNVSVKIEEEGENTFYVVAYDANDTASAPIKVTITGK